MTSISKILTISLIDESKDDELAEYTYLDEEFDILFDDEANDDLQVGDEVLDESTNGVPHLDDFIDEAIDDYDYTDSFIDDGPLVDEVTEDDFDSEN